MAKIKSKNISDDLLSNKEEIIQKSNKDMKSRNSAFLSDKKEIMQEGKISYKDSRYK